jgi:hypothetical protein
MNSHKTVTAMFVPPIALTALTLPNGEVGLPYSAPLVTGGIPPFTFTLKRKNAFPSGLSGNSANGLLTGTPKAAKAVTFTVTIADQLGSSVIGTFKVTILGALNISTKSLKAGTHTKSYNVTLAATGGKKPYNWSLLSGTLPAGLSLNGSTGAITGVPTEIGTFHPTFKVTDPLGGQAQKTFTLTIK